MKEYVKTTVYDMPDWRYTDKRFDWQLPVGTVCQLAHKYDEQRRIVKIVGYTGYENNIHSGSHWYFVEDVNKPLVEPFYWLVWDGHLSILEMATK